MLDGSPQVLRNFWTQFVIPGFLAFDGLVVVEFIQLCGRKTK